MDNKAIAGHFNLLGKLMDLHGENTFRVRNIVNAAFRINKLDFQLAEKSPEEWALIPGIGKSTSQKISELVETGTLAELNQYVHQTPPGIIEMLSLKGIGPKKIKTLWDLGLTDMGEVLYACNENRLVEAKGFGAKTQEQIKKIILFAQANKGWVLFGHVQDKAEKAMADLKKYLSTDTLIAFTGDFRRKCEVLQHVDILHTASLEQISAFSKQHGWEVLSEEEGYFQSPEQVKYRFIGSTRSQFGHDLIKTTGSAEHLLKFTDHSNNSPFEDLSEEEIYEHLNMDFIPAVLREGLNELDLAKNKELPRLITFQDLKGALHNHSTYSDGAHSLSEMADFAKNTLKLHYFGIADHSKSAVYARGMNEDNIYQQWQEINRLNLSLAPFKILKGIESDILVDGSLDYGDSILEGFDYVVASIHSVLNMDIKRATDRLIKAIENPFTTILGHPTGRLLLSRSGYEIDYKKVIDACAANQVAIEINANPLRLDLDWRWHRYALERGVYLCINPDAHRKEGLWDMKYGVNAAQKGGVQIQNCLNAWDLVDLEKFLKR